MNTTIKRVASATLAIITLLSMLMVGGIMPASADDTVTVKSNGYSFSYEAGGTWTSDLDGFSVSDGSLAICTQLDVNPPGSGGTTYKLAKNLGTSYTDGDKTIDTKFAFKAFYYGEKNRSTNSALKDLNTYQLTLAINCVARGYFSNLTVSAGTNTFSQNIIRAVQTIRSLANADADKIGSKITIKDGVATCETTGYTARMAFFTSTTSGTQRIMIYDAKWQPREENGAIEVYKKDGDGKALAGATFTVYDSTGKRFTTIGPTDSKGYAISDGGASDPSVPLGTYTVVETTFPTNYTHNGTTSWTVTVKANETTKIGGNAGVTNVLKKGAIGAVKVDAAGNPLSGVTFGVYSDSACKTKIGEMTTGNDGKATYGVSGTTYSLDCTKTFYVKETKAQSNDYVLDTKVYSATIVADKVTYVNNGNGIPNYLKGGALSVYKTDADSNPLSGVVFGVYSDKDCKNKLGQMTTGADGKATYGVAADGSYTLTCRQTLYVQEIQPKDDTYVRNNTIYDVTIAADQITAINGGNPIVNKQKYWDLKLYKVDAATGQTTLGDISVAGAVYGLFDANDKKLAEYTTDSKGQFTTDKFVAGTGYYLQELVAPEGFRLDDTKIRLDNLVSGSELTAEMTTVEKTAIERPKTGNISIVKFTPPTSNDDTSYIPEEGAAFVAYLSSFGSYEAAVAAGDDRFYDNCVVDATGNGVWSNGKIVSKDLVYGTYTVHQTKSIEGRIPTDDFKVEVKEDGKTYSYTLNNRIYDTTLIVNKRDAETGELIVKSPASFKIKNLATGEFVTYKMVYPTQSEVDEFNTSNGSFTLPMALPYGDYEIIETKAPEGYELNATPIKFSVTESTPAVSTVDFYDGPLKGRIEIEKLGKQFTSIKESESEFGTVYTPVFTETHLGGVTFEIIAAEDIVGGDNTVHYKAGEVVDMIITSVNGPVQTGELYLGKYNVVESWAPAGYIIDATPHTVTVTNDGSSRVSVTKETYSNDRATSSIKLLKEAEVWEDVVTEEGDVSYNRVIKVVPGAGFTFGIYSAQEFSVVSKNNVSGGVVGGSSNTNREIGSAPNLGGNTNIPGAVGGADGSDDSPVVVPGPAPSIGLINIPEGALMAVVTTDENGEINFTNDLPFGNYVVKELKAPDAHYVLEQNVFPIELVADNKTTEIVVKINDGEAVFNTFPHYPVEIKKVDENGEDLAGALIEIKDENDNIVYRNYTNEEGVLADLILEPGEYTYTELEAPVGYIRELATFAFTVDADGNVTGDNVLKNRPTEIIITKTDLTKSETIPGAEIAIYGPDGEEVFRDVTDENGQIKMTHLLINTKYTFKETLAPDGYAINTAEFTFEIKEDGTIVGDTEIVDDVTKIKIYKVNEKDEPMAGVEFTMYDGNGDAIATAVTDKDGVAMFTGFKQGEYTIKETKTIDGYDLAPDSITLENDGKWDNDADTATVKVVNYPTVVPPTGDITNILLNSVMALVSLIGLLTTIVVVYRKKRNANEQ